MLLDVFGRIVDGTRKLGAKPVLPGVAPTLSARLGEDSGLADHQALPSRFHNCFRHLLKRVDFENFG